MASPLEILAQEIADNILYRRPAAPVPASQRVIAGQAAKTDALNKANAIIQRVRETLWDQCLNPNAVGDAQIIQFIDGARMLGIYQMVNGSSRQMIDLNKLAELQRTVLEENNHRDLAEANKKYGTFKEKAIKRANDYYNHSLDDLEGVMALMAPQPTNTQSPIVQATAPQSPPPKSKYPDHITELASAIVLRNRTKNGIPTSTPIGQAEENAARAKARSIMKILHTSIMDRKRVPQVSDAEVDAVLQPFRSPAHIVDIDRMSADLLNTAAQLKIRDMMINDKHADKHYQHTKKTINEAMAWAERTTPAGMLER